LLLNLYFTQSVTIYFEKIIIIMSIDYVQNWFLVWYLFGYIWLSLHICVYFANKIFTPNLFSCVILYCWVFSSRNYFMFCRYNYYWCYNLWLICGYCVFYVRNVFETYQFQIIIQILIMSQIYTLQQQQQWFILWL